MLSTQKTEGCYFHRSVKPHTAAHNSHDSEDFFDRLKVSDIEEFRRQRYRQQRIMNRSAKLMTDASNKSFRMSRLKASVSRLRKTDI
jgi:hypothetical protein